LIGWSEPSDWTLVSRSVQSHTFFDRFVVQYKGEARQRMDEIRVGTTWQSVIFPWVAGIESFTDSSKLPSTD
jgi:hypothetical protein